MRLKLFAASVCLLLPAALHATSISGTISVSGNDTFDSSQITFYPRTGVVYQASGTMTSYAPVTVGSLSASYIATLTSFTFANATGTTLFSVVNNQGQTLSFTISNLTSSVVGTDTNGPTLSLSGLGYFTQTSYDTTSGKFSLTSSTAGITGFRLVTSTAAAAAAVTPEPGSLLLLATGMIGMAAPLVRRRLTA